MATVRWWLCSTRGRACSHSAARSVNQWLSRVTKVLTEVLWPCERTALGGKFQLSTRRASSSRSEVTRSGWTQTELPSTLVTKPDNYVCIHTHHETLVSSMSLDCVPELQQEMSKAPPRSQIHNTLTFWSPYFLPNLATRDYALYGRLSEITGD